MVRASFRIGLRLGVLFGVAFALYRTVQSRRATKEPAPEPWQPIVDTPRPRAEPQAAAATGRGAAATAPAAPPAATTPQPADLRMPDVPPKRPRDEVGEPIEEPAAVEPAASTHRTAPTPAGAAPASADAASATPEHVPAPAPAPAPSAPEPEPERVADPEPAMQAEPLLDAAPPATLVSGELHPLDVVPEPAAAPAPVKKAAKRAAKKAAKKRAAAATGKKVAPTAAATPSPDELTAPPEGADAAPQAERDAGAAPAWVKPADGICPKTHPVKAKLASRLFHLPGMLAYDRTRADRCYGNEQAAVEDGFVRAKR